MADGVKISQLPGASTPSDSDVVAGVHGGTTKKFSFANIYAWLKSRLVLEDIGAVPDSRTVNGKALSSDISLTASDVGARPDNWFPTAAQVGARPDTWTPSAQDVGAVPVAAVGVAGGVPNLDEIGRVPVSQLPPYPTVPAASTANPQMDGTASPGSTGEWADGGHVHPTDTTRVPTSRTINGYDLTQDRSLTAADVGALASDGTAVGASNLRYSYRIDGSNGVWFQFMQFTLSDNETTKFLLFFTDGGNAYQGLLNCRFHHASGGSISATVRWWAKNGYSVSDIRYTVDQTTETITLYIHKRSPSFILFYNLLSSDRTAYKNISSYFTALQVSEPTTATSAGGVRADLDGAGNNIADGRLWFSSVAVSAGTAQQILAITDATITADYVLARIEWADPSYITAGYTWTTGAGSFTLSGTATAATTANILLVRKGN
jgi:hypothetical protein